jgi:hypothetical protein
VTLRAWTARYDRAAADQPLGECASRCMRSRPRLRRRGG